jgi:uncharacterized damage-inducible protein DinB
MLFYGPSEAEEMQPITGQAQPAIPTLAYQGRLAQSKERGAIQTGGGAAFSHHTGGRMLSHSVGAACASAGAASDYVEHFGALSKLSGAVAEAMPPEQYAFRPDPGSMSFGELMSHVAQTNYQFCAGLKDVSAANMPSPTDKDGIVKFLSNSFEYCSDVIPNLTADQVSKVHDSPDGRMPGREVLLAMYIHVAHHRGQAEVYLRDKDIRPSSYRFCARSAKGWRMRPKSE